MSALTLNNIDQQFSFLYRLTPVEGETFGKSWDRARIILLCKLKLKLLDYDSLLFNLNKLIEEI